MRRTKSEQDEVDYNIRSIFNDNPNAKYSDIHSVISCSDKTIHRIKAELGLARIKNPKNISKKSQQKSERMEFQPNPNSKHIGRLESSSLDKYIKPSGEEMWFLIRCIRNEVIKHPKLKPTALGILRKIFGIRKISLESSPKPKTQ